MMDSFYQQAIWLLSCWKSKYLALVLKLLDPYPLPLCMYMYMYIDMYPLNYINYFITANDIPVVCEYNRKIWNLKSELLVLRLKFKKKTRIINVMMEFPTLTCS